MYFTDFMFSYGVDKFLWENSHLFINSIDTQIFYSFIRFYSFCLIILGHETLEAEGGE